MKQEFLKMSYNELINYVCDRDTYNECISEEELLEIINDTLAYGFYGQAKDLIDVLMEQRNAFDGNNYWHNDCDDIRPLLTEKDILDEFDYMFE